MVQTKVENSAIQLSSAMNVRKIWDGIIYNVKAYGAKLDDETDNATFMQKSVDAAAVTGGTVVFPPGTYKTGSFTVPSNVTLWFMNGAKLSINSGATVAINGPIDAGLYQIFSGLGVVIGNMQVPCYYPQWWGAKGDKSQDDYPALQATVNSALTNTRQAQLIVITPGEYLLSQSLIVPHGGVTTNVIIWGYGARLLEQTVGMTLIKIVANGDPAQFLNVGNTKIFGLRFYGTGAGSTGISIGKRSNVATDYGLSGVVPSVIKDCVFEPTMQYGIIVSNARMFIFDNCSMSTTLSPSFGIYFQSVYDGFTGDCWIKNCNLATAGTGAGIYLTATSISGSSSIAGIHIENCVCYGNAIHALTTNANATIKDLFIEGVATDAQTVNDMGMNFESFAAGSISQVFITDPWINGHIVGIAASNSSTIVVTSGKVSSTGVMAVDFEDSNDCKVIGLTMFDVNKNGNGGGVVKLGGVGARNKVIGCNLFNTASYTMQFIYIAPTQNKPIVTQNQTDGTTAGFIQNNVAGVEGTNFIVAGNL